MGGSAGRRERVVGVLSASPFTRGRCDAACDACVESVGRAGCRACRLTLRDYEVAPCRGCNACAATGACVISDDFPRLVGDLDALDALVVVSPVYFAGPPATLKAALDRMQVLWALRYRPAGGGAYPALPDDGRRALGLAAVGSGGDPFGDEPLSTCLRSAMRMLDFELRARVSCGAGDDAGAVCARLGVDVSADALRRPPFSRARRAHDLLGIPADAALRGDAPHPR